MSGAVRIATAVVVALVVYLAVVPTVIFQTNPPTCHPLFINNVHSFSSTTPPATRGHPSPPQSPPLC